MIKFARSYGTLKWSLYYNTHCHITSNVDCDVAASYSSISVNSYELSFPYGLFSNQLIVFLSKSPNSWLDNFMLISHCKTTFWVSIPPDVDEIKILIKRDQMAKHCSFNHNPLWPDCDPINTSGGFEHSE